MKLNTKKFAALLMAAVMSVIALPISAQAALQKPEPRASVNMTFTTPPPTEVYGGETFAAAVSFISVLGGEGEPVTITAAGGQIVPSSIVFKANGVETPIKSLSVTDGRAAFTTGRPAANPLANEITFQVTAGERMLPMEVSLKVGVATAANVTGVNYVSKTVAVIPSLSLDAIQKSGPADGIYGRPWAGFEVSGETLLPGASFIVVSAKTSGGSLVYDSLIPLSSFMFKTWVPFLNYPSGSYDITAAVLDGNYNTLAERTVRVTHRQGFLEGEHTVTTKIYSANEIVGTVAETYPHGWPIQITKGDTVNFHGANYTLQSASVNGYTMTSGIHFLTGATTINLYCN